MYLLCFKGIKDIAEYFSKQTTTSVSNSINGPGSRSISQRNTLNVHNNKTFSASVSGIFKYYFPEHSFSIIATFQPVRRPFGVYLVSVYDAKRALVLGIKLFGGTVILEYAKGQRFVAFDVSMRVGKWHRAALSIKNKQVTLYWNCEKSGTKSLPAQFSFSSYAKGTLHLGKLGRGYQRYKMEVCEYFVGEREGKERKAIYH